MSMQEQSSFNQQSFSQQSQQSQQQQQQQVRQHLQQATERLMQSQDPSEQAQWAQQVRQYADQLSSSGRRSQKTAVSIDAVIPSPESFSQLAQQLQSSTPGLKEVSFRRDGNTPRIRIQATHEALPRIQQVLNEVGRTVQQAYGGSAF